MSINFQSSYSWNAPTNAGTQRMNQANGSYSSNYTGSNYGTESSYGPQQSSYPGSAYGLTNKNSEYNKMNEKLNSYLKQMNQLSLDVNNCGNDYINGRITKKSFERSINRIVTLYNSICTTYTSLKGTFELFYKENKDNITSYYSGITYPEMEQLNVGMILWYYGIR